MSRLCRYFIPELFCTLTEPARIVSPPSPGTTRKRLRYEKLLKFLNRRRNRIIFRRFRHPIPSQFPKDDCFNSGDPQLSEPFCRQAAISAVCLARESGLVIHKSKGISFIPSAVSSASRIPFSFNGISVCPCIFPSTFHDVSPCLIKYKTQCADNPLCLYGLSVLLRILTRESAPISRSAFCCLQEKRLELSWYCYRTDLNRTRLPIPPLLHLSFSVQHCISVVSLLTKDILSQL